MYIFAVFSAAGFGNVMNGGMSDMNEGKTCHYSRQLVASAVYNFSLKCALS